MKAKSLFASIEPLELRIAPATFTVTTTADVGAGSLRQAILDANGTPGLDTIVFKLAADSTIILASEIPITDSVNILGPGAGKLAVSGNNNSRIFNIDDGSSSTIKTVKITGLTLRNGNAGVGNTGGAILDRETLTIENCVLFGNTAGSDGGAIKVSTAGKFTMKNTKVTGNTATNGDGGGLYVSTEGGTLITGSVISGNTSGDQGGGLYARITGSTPKAALIIDKTTISGNSAEAGGGGLWLRNNSNGPDGMNGTKDDGMVIVKNSLITGNRVTGASALGGGLYLLSGHAVVQNTSIINNTAPSRGGGLAVGSGIDSLIVKSSRIAGNSTTDAADPSSKGGGGVFLSGAKTFTFQSTTFSGNISALDGGALLARDGAIVKIMASTFTNNRTIGDDGGAIYVASDTGARPTLEVIGSKFIDNRTAQNGSARGGAISTSGAQILKVTGAQFLSNYAGGDGGAIDTIDADGSSTTINILSSKFTGNVADSEGGAMYLRSSGAITVASSLFFQNSAITANGGAVSLGGAGAKLFTKVTMKDNYARLTGGGISLFTAGSSLTVVSSIITGNIASANGGGIANYSGSPGNLIVSSSNVTGNSAAVNPQIKS